jgi:hypothetical protein
MRAGPFKVDEVAQMPVVGLHRALAGPHPLALEPEQAEVEHYFSMPGQLVRAAQVAGN